MPFRNTADWVTDIVVPVLVLLLALTACAASSVTQKWHLPRGAAVKDDGARTYRFTIDYANANGRGEIVQRQRLTGEYTRGLADGRVEWNNVAQAQATGATGSFGTAQKREFMQAFHYRNDLAGTLQPEFFKGFPAAAVQERNLVWDTGMIEHFGQDFFEHLELNEPYHVAANQDIEMPDVGTFRNRDVVLEWIGRSRRNGQDCAVISYQAFLNPLRIANQGMSLLGRSEYWGQIWVSLASKQVEYSTIHENVIAEMVLPGQERPQLISVFRSGVLEPTPAK